MVAYTRVSDPSQVEGHSLDAQKADIIRWCQRRGYELISTYVEDGKSARSERIERRPKIMALLEDAKARQFDIVVVHTIDRGPGTLECWVRPYRCWATRTSGLPV